MASLRRPARMWKPGNAPSLRAEAELATAATAETNARESWRETQHATDAAREEHAAAEREISRNAARVSALKEAKQRTGSGRAEAIAARQSAEQALAALAGGRRP